MTVVIEAGRRGETSRGDGPSGDASAHDASGRAGRRGREAGAKEAGAKEAGAKEAGAKEAGVRETGAREAGPRRAETRQRILEAAGRLFRAQGIDATGVDAIMREAGLTHGGFYLHFSSKEALAAEVAGSLLQGSARRWRDAGSNADPARALRQIVQTYLDPERVAAGRCCALASLGPDVARRPASREAMGDALRSMLGSLTRCLPENRPEQAMVALSTMVGAVVLSRLADDPALAAAFLDATRGALLPAQDGASETMDLTASSPRARDDVA